MSSGKRKGEQTRKTKIIKTKRKILQEYKEQRGLAQTREMRLEEESCITFHYASNYLSIVFKLLMLEGSYGAEKGIKFKKSVCARIIHVYCACC